MRELAGHPIAIDHLTTVGATPEEMVEIAAGLDVGFVTPISMTPGGWVAETFDLRPGTAHFAEMKAALARTGVKIGNMDGLSLQPENNWDELEARVEGAAELGAQAIVTLSFDSDAERYFEGYCRLAELAAPLGLLIGFEFATITKIPDLAAALALMKRGGYDHARVVVDIMHLTLSGGTPDDISGMDDTIILGAQFCDGPLQRTLEEYMHDVVERRGLPGEGEYPLVEFVRALPEGVRLGLEIPRTAERQAGVSAAERARRAVDATMALGDRI